MNKKRKPLRRILILGLMLLVIFIGCATNIKTVERDLRFSEVPVGMKDYKVVFISDLHINKLLSQRYFEKVVERLHELQPDLILMGGDYIDENTDDLEKAISLLAPLREFPSVAVLGNHDHWLDGDRVESLLVAQGIRVLRNESLRWPLEKGELVLAGVDDIYNFKDDMEATLDGLTEEDFVILLSHSPEPFSYIQMDKRVDMMLAGHTHGGQITFFGLWAPYLPLNDRTYWKGYYSGSENQLLITNGIGSTTYGIRFFARPSIEVLRFTIEDY